MPAELITTYEKLCKNVFKPLFLAMDRLQHIFLFFFFCLFTLPQGSSTLRAACGPRASLVRPGKGISQNTVRYEY